MKGRILGFTPSSGTGTITGDDGNRYGFSQAEWRSDKPIAAGTAVDFELRGSEAIGIYPVAAAIGTVDMAALAASPAVAKTKALLTGTLAFPLALVLLIACLLTAMSSPERSVNMLNLGDVVGRLGPLASGSGDHADELADLDKEQASLDQAARTQGADVQSPGYGYGTIGERLKQIAEQRAKIEKIASGERMLSITRSILFVRFAVPLCAFWLLWAVWAGLPAVRVASLATGVSAVIAGLLPHLLKHALIGALGNFGAGMDDALSVGIGAWVLLIGGVALILAGLGRIQNPLAKAG